MRIAGKVFLCVVAVLCLALPLWASGGDDRVPPPKDKILQPLACTGAADKPIDLLGKTRESLSGSVVVFNPAAGGDVCYAGGTTQTFCFATDTYTDDWEYIYTLWMKFPAGWTVTNVALTGSPICQDGGTWGSLVWSTPNTSNEVRIDHARYQAYTDHCTASYCVTVAVPGGASDGLVSWYWDGDGYGSAPHNPCSSDNYTPAGQSPCDQAVSPRAGINSCTGVSLSSDHDAMQECRGTDADYTFTVANNTGGPATFGITHSGNGWPVTHPASVGPVANGATQSFTVTHSIPFAAAEGSTDTVTVTATDLANPGTTASKAVTTTAASTGSWSSVPSSAPGWAGSGYPCDSCTAQNAAGHWVTYLLGDTTIFSGFWGYDHNTNTWFNPGASGTPGNRWAPDWAYDPETNRCYVTGGATTPGGGNLNDAYVYDPVANAFTALPSFTHARDFHDSWVGRVDGVKYLAIGGGVDAGSTVFTSTQTYNLDTLPGSWGAENAVIPAYPVAGRWGAADGILHAPAGDQFWFVSGADASFYLDDSAWYFDDADNAWHAAGSPGSPRYRVEGEFVGNAFYRIGGSSGGFSPTNDVYKYSGGIWTHEASAPNIRMDNIVGVTPDGLWSVDGYGSGAPNYVDVMEICNACGVITIEPAVLPPILAGAPFSQMLQASGGTPPYTFAVTEGLLPDGLTLDPGGLLSGTPTVSGAYSFEITAMDAGGCTGEYTYEGTALTFYFLDDYLRSSFCADTVTGTYLWNITSGPEYGAVLTGAAKVFNAGGKFTSFPGDPNGSFSVVYDPVRHKASGWLITAAGHYVPLTDKNTLNNPGACNWEGQTPE
jgi:hypothetical protein